MILLREGLLVSLYALACLAFGLLLVRWLAPRGSFGSTSQTLALVATGFLLGQGILAVIWQFVLMLGWFTTPVVILLLIAITVPGLPYLWSLLPPVSQLILTAVSRLSREPWYWQLLIIIILVLIAVASFVSLLPPQARGDALAYYLALPKLFAASGRMEFLPGYTGFDVVGIQAEYHFAALMVLGGMGKTIIVPVVLALFAIMIALGKESALGHRGLWLLLALVLTSSMVTQLIWDGKTDLLGTALGVAACYWAIFATSDAGSARIAGLLGGLSIIAKMSLLAIMPPILLVIIIWRFRPDVGVPFRLWGRQLLVRLLWVGGFALLALLPNALKNAIVYQAPLAPLIGGVIPFVEQSWYSPEDTQRLLISYPFALVFGNYWAQVGQMSPLWLAFLPLVILLKPPQRFSKSILLQLTIAGLLGVLVWVLFKPTIFAPRYFMPPLLLLLLPAARAAERGLDRLNAPLGSLIFTVTAGTLTIVLFGYIRGNYVVPAPDSMVAYAARLAVGEASPCQYEYLGSDASCAVAEIISTRAEPHDRVFPASYYTYWLDSPQLQCLPTAEEQEQILNQPSTQERWAMLYKLGFKFFYVDTLLYNDYNFDRTFPPGWLQLETLWERDTFVLYQLHALDSEHQPERLC